MPLLFPFFFFKQYPNYDVYDYSEGEITTDPSPTEAAKTQVKLDKQLLWVSPYMYGFLFSLIFSFSSSHFCPLCLCWLYFLATFLLLEQLLVAFIAHYDTYSGYT